MRLELLSRTTKPAGCWADAVLGRAQSPGPASPLSAHLFKLANGGRAAGGILAHTHGSVALVQLAHLAVLAVVILAGVWECRAWSHTTRPSTSSPTQSSPILGQKPSPVLPTLGFGQLSPPLSSAEARIGI